VHPATWRRTDGQPARSAITTSRHIEGHQTTSRLMGGLERHDLRMWRMDGLRPDIWPIQFEVQFCSDCLTELNRLAHRKHVGFRRLFTDRRQPDPAPQRVLYSNSTTGRSNMDIQWRQITRQSLLREGMSGRAAPYCQLGIFVPRTISLRTDTPHRGQPC